MIEDYNRHELEVSANSSGQAGIGIANGTFGEFIQGPLGEQGAYNLVTLPIRRYSRAFFVPDRSASSINVFPPNKIKAKVLTKMFVDHYGYQTGGSLTITSELPEGKGMASSSADLVATARALSRASGIQIDLTVLQKHLREIEPTDGVMYPGVVSYFYRMAAKHLRLGNMFDCRIIYIDEGGIIETVSYNKAIEGYSSEEAREYSKLHRDFVNAFGTRDLPAIGQLSTQSAILNQKRNRKMFLDDVISICKRRSGIGVVATHSGPCLGIIVDKEDPLFEKKCSQIILDLNCLKGAVGYVDSLHIEDGKRPAVISDEV